MLLVNYVKAINTMVYYCLAIKNTISDCHFTFVLAVP